MEKGTEKRSWLTGAWRGAAASVVGYFLLLALAAYLTMNGRVGEQLAGRAAWLCAAAAALIGSLVSARGRSADVRPPLLCATGFFTFTVLAGFLAQTEFSPAGALAFASAVIAGTLPSLLLRRGGRGKRGKRRKTGRSAR